MRESHLASSEEIGRESMAKTWHRQACHSAHLQNSAKKTPEVWNGLPLRWFAASASHQRWVGTAARRRVRSASTIVILSISIVNLF